MTREHNDANMLAMGAGIVGPNLALSIVETFLNTPFPAMKSMSEESIRLKKK